MNTVAVGKVSGPVVWLIVGNDGTGTVIRQVGFALFPETASKAALHHPSLVWVQMTPFSPEELGRYSFGAISLHRTSRYHEHRLSSGPWHMTVSVPLAKVSFRARSEWRLSRQLVAQVQRPKVGGGVVGQLGAVMLRMRASVAVLHQSLTSDVG